MAYRFALDSRSYEDLASGRVLRTAHGQAALPVRVAREMFEQAIALRPAGGADGQVALYDPCCGAGHSLAALGFLYRSQLRAVVGSDVDQAAVGLCRQNLALLQPQGLHARIHELTALLALEQRPAYQAALDSARALAASVPAGVAPAVHCFVADARVAAQLRVGIAGSNPEIVIVDVPYGRLSRWRTPTGSDPGDDGALFDMLEAAADVLAAGAVVALATGKRAKVVHQRFRRARQTSIGLRRLTWLVRN